MPEGDYEKILEKISTKSGLEKEELNKRVEAKRTKLSGLISKEGAAQIIAAELGISFDNEKLKINELHSGVRKFIVVGKIINLFPVRTFNRDGKDSKVANFILADETSNIKVVLWDEHHISLIEKGEISEGKSVEIANSSLRGDELHLGSFSEIKLVNKVFDKINTGKIFKEKKIIEFKPSDNATVRAFIVQAFDPKFFNVCPECKKKVNPEVDGFSCAEHGKVAHEKRALISIVLDDGTATIRSVLFHEGLPKLGINNLENTEELSKQKEILLGKEMLFSGNVRISKFSNEPEFIVGDVKEVNLDGLIEKLEKK